jgi:diguanylate cyclase (GGDEF)-like protein
MLLILYGFSVQPFALWPVPIWVIVVSSLLMAVFVAVLTVPGNTLSTFRFIGALTVGNAVLLLGTVSAGEPETIVICKILLLLTMASYVSSLTQFGLLSSVLVGAYGLLLYYHHHWLETEAALVLPSLLCLILAFLSKMGMFDAQLRQLVGDEVPPNSTTAKDALTGLANRGQFLEQVNRVIQYRYLNRKFHFAVLFLDLDGFKPINDRFGHKAGDVVLRHIAKRLQSCVRKGDLVGRHGGDEFTILLNRIKGSEEVAKMAQAILTKIRTPIDVEEPVMVGTSIGIALSTNLHEGAEDLIRDADAAMYQAKQQGKNCYVFSDQSNIPREELLERWKRVAQTNWMLRER